jgi:hypothetical protein
MTESIKTRGQQAYEDYWERQMADPEFRKIYEEEAAKKSCGSSSWKRGSQQDSRRHRWVSDWACRKPR